MNRKDYFYLLDAIKAKNISVIDNFLKTDSAVLNSTPPDNLTSPLCYAIRCGNVIIVKHLIEAGADVNFTPEYMLYPLMEAVKLSDKKAQILYLLLEKGANINAALKDKQTALHFAVQNRNAIALKILLDKGADPEIGAEDMNYSVQGKNLYTPLYLAVLDNYREIIEILLEAGADPNIGKATEKWSQNLLYRAISRKSKWLVALLLKYGAWQDHRGLSVSQQSELNSLLSLDIHSTVEDIALSPKDIKNLDLRGLPIKELPQGIQQLPVLERLYLGANLFKKLHLADLAAPQLSCLHLQNALLTDLTGDNLPSLFPNLRVLDLRGNKLKKSLVQSLKKELPNCVVIENDAEWDAKKAQIKTYLL